MKIWYKIHVSVKAFFTWFFSREFDVNLFSTFFSNENYIYIFIWVKIHVKFTWVLNHVWHICMCRLTRAVAWRGGGGRQNSQATGLLTVFTQPNMSMYMCMTKLTNDVGSVWLRNHYFRQIDLLLCTLYSALFILIPLL